MADVTRVIKILLDDKDLETKQANQQKKLERLEKQIKNFDPGTTKWKELDAQIDKTKTTIGKYADQLSGKVGPTLNQLKQKQRELNKELAEMPLELQKSSAASKKLEVVESHLRQVRAEANKTSASMKGMSMSKMADGFNKYFGMATAGVAALTGVTMAISSQVSYLLELDDAYADVAKTTGLTIDEVKELSGELGKINTRTSRKELLQLSAEAGKLGITGKKNIYEFVEAADKINVALGEDLGQGAIINIGKMNELFGTTAIYGYGESMTKTGSAINAVGAASMAAEGYIVEFSKRVGGIGSQAELTIPDIIGLASTLDNLGQSSEMSATAVQQFISGMFSDTSANAKVAGMDLKAFEKLLSEDVSGAFVKVLQGVKGTGSGMREMLGNMKALGIDGARGSQVISALAGNTELLVKQQKLANEEYQKGTSIQDEFNTKNENMAAKAEKIGKRLHAIFNNIITSEMVDNVLKFTEKILGAQNDVIQGLKDEQTQLGLSKIALRDVNTTAEERKKIIDELKQTYPQYLSQINTEKVNNEELFTALNNVNDSLVNKIIIQKEQEKIDERAGYLAKYKIKEIEAETQLRKKLSEAETEHGLKLTEKGDIEKQIMEAQEKLRAKGERYDANVLKVALNEYRSRKKSVDELTGSYNKLISKRDELKEKLGVNFKPVPTSVSTPENPTGIKPTVPPSAPTDAEVKAQTKFQKLQDDRLKYFAEIQERMGKIKETDDMKSMTADEKEVAMEKAKFDEIIKYTEEKGKELKLSKEQISEQVIAIKAAEAAAINDIEEKQRIAALAAELDVLSLETEKANEYEKKKAEFVEANRVRNLSIKQKEIEENEKFYNKLIEQAQFYGLSIEKLEEEKALKKKEIEEKNNEEDKKKQQEKTKEYIDGTVAIANELASSINQINQQNRDARVSDEIESLNKEREAELSNKKLSEAQKEAINKKYDEREKQVKLQAWKADQNAAITMATINGAVAVTKALATGNIAMAIIAGITTALQVAVISNQKPPKYAKGGLLKGPSHADEGIKMVRSDTGEIVGEAEGGEPLLSIETRRNNRELVDALLYTSMNRNGARINVPSLGYQNPVNFSRVANAQRFAKGGTVSPAPVVNVAAPEIPAQDNSSMETLITLNIATLKQLMATPIKAYAIIDAKTADDINELITDNQAARESAGF